MSIEKKLILFTGQSGIQVKKCLKRINDALENTYNTISVEDTMSEISGRNFRKEILQEKLPYQYELWGKAFKEILKKIENDGNNESFINLHSIFYHQDKREYVSVIDFNLIQELKNKVKILIVFIDDIYDIYQRLLEKNEMFHKVMIKKEPLNAIFESIFNIKTLLEWRQMEITISRIISRFLEIRMFIVATKHPTFMIKRLIDNKLEDLEYYYISHPISEIRRKSEIIYDVYPGELNTFIQDVQKYQKKIFFLPTTIDEYRIQHKNGLLVPEFQPRWALHFRRSELINGSFSLELNAPNPLNPLNLNINECPEGTQQSISILIKLLLNCIYDQITSRDLSLVEQSTNGLILYRPDYPTEYSGGIIRELRYNLDLYNRDQKSRKLFRFSLEEECTRIRIYTFFNLIKNNSIVEDKKEIMDDIFGKIEDWIDEHKWIEIFKDKDILKSKINSIREVIECYLDDFTFDETLFGISYSLKGLDIAEDEKNRCRGYEIIIDKIFEDALEIFMINKEDFKKYELRSDINLSTIFNNI